MSWVACETRSLTSVAAPCTDACNATASPRLPIEETKEQRKRFKTYEIGYVHIDSCELHHAEGKLVMFLAIDRVSKFPYVEFHDSAGKMEGSAFLSNAVEVIHTVLTDNGMAFADLPKNRGGPMSWPSSPPTTSPST